MSAADLRLKYLWAFAVELNCPPPAFDLLSRADTAAGIGFLMRNGRRASD